MDPFSSLAQKMIPIFCDALLHLDEQAWEPLKPQLNKIICFKIDPFKPIYFQIQAQGLKALAPQEEVDTYFSGTPQAFLTLLFAPKHLHKSLHIKGDMECAKAFYDAFQRLDIDWEGHLAKLIGGPLAHNLCEMFRHSQEWFSQTWEARTHDFSAYLQDEIKLLPTRQECENFFKEVDVLRHDCERLSARLHILQQRLTQKE